MNERDWGSLPDRISERVRASGVGTASWQVSLGERAITGALGTLVPGDAATPAADGASIYRVASVTKPIVAAAALQAVGNGLIGLHDSIEALLPELADRTVLTDSEGPLDQPVVAAERALSLHDLLSFRCGWGMDFGDTEPPHLQELWRLGIGPGPGAPTMTPQEFLTRLGRLPLQEQPGTRWRYHVGYDVLGILLERLHGADLGEVLQRDLFDPLGMASTGFWVEAEQRHRLGDARVPREDGMMRTWDSADGLFAGPPAFRSGAAGLATTTTDLAAFARMLLAGGRGPDGAPVLAPASVELMMTDALTAEQRGKARLDEHSDAVGWGLGLAVRHRPEPGQPWPGPGVCWWDGGTGARLLVDPGRDVSVVVLSSDGFGAPGMPQVLDDVVAEVAATLA